jgi:kojibiose phosphorylase
LRRTYRFDRVVAVHTSRDAAEPFASSRGHVEFAIEDVDGVTAEHGDAWLTRWKAADLRTKSDPAAQRALRFAFYHLSSAANPEDDRCQSAHAG